MESAQGIHHLPFRIRLPQAVARDPVAFARLVAQLSVDNALEIESLEMADENVQAVYDYLIGTAGEQT